MRLIVITLFALWLLFEIAAACKCGYGCGCGCGGCGCGCGGCGGCGWGGYGCGCGCGGLCSHSYVNHIVHKDHAHAPSVVGIPVLGQLGIKGCGCRGACTCGGSWD